MSWQGRHRRVLRTVLLAALLACALAAPALAADPPPGSSHREAYFESADGKATLHADILRPAGLPDDVKTPVILSVGPYFNRTGQLGPLGLIQDAPYDPAGGGLSDRFFDFINGAKLLERGYTWVQVDLRGFGGSSGCLDWAGPGEQADVKAAVEWAASQPWSTGRVGMYGKSYDGVTGMLGIVQQPRGLAAVVSQEPVYDLYRYLYMNRVRFINSLLTPNLYNAIAGSPGGPGDGLAYNQASVDDLSRPGCPAFNFADQQNPDHSADYWRQRDLITLARGKTTPFFLTQGFIENNTKPDGAFDFYNGMAGPKRAWFGQWDHVRGNDRTEDGRLAMGREGWFDEVMRFYDRYVAEKPPAEAPVENDPPIALQTNDGRWRSEAAWPPPDSFAATAALKPGSYEDDAANNGTAEGGAPNGIGIWTFSPVLDHEVRFAGIPRLTVDVETQGPDANLTAAIYDVDARNNATLISRGTYLLPGSGKVAFDLYGNDWKIRAGHRIGVLVSSSHSEWWAHVPTGQTVEVKSASVTMPYLTCRRDRTLAGATALKLEDYLRSAPFEVDAGDVTAGVDPAFPLPRPLEACSASELVGGPATVPVSEGGGSGATPATSPAGCVDRRKFSFRIHRPRRGYIVKAVAYVNGKRKAAVKGRKIRRIRIQRLPLGVFTVKIVATASTGAKTISVRRYNGCGKGRPSTTVQQPGR